MKFIFNFELVRRCCNNTIFTLWLSTETRFSINFYSDDNDNESKDHDFFSYTYQNPAPRPPPESIGEMMMMMMMMMLTMMMMMRRRRRMDDDCDVREEGIGEEPVGVNCLRLRGEAICSKVLYSAVDHWVQTGCSLAFSTMGPTRDEQNQDKSLKDILSKMEIISFEGSIEQDLNFWFSPSNIISCQIMRGAGKRRDIKGT